MYLVCFELTAIAPVSWVGICAYYNEDILIALLHEVSQCLTLLPLLIRRINHSWNHLSSLGSIQLNCCHFAAYRANQTQQPTLPSQLPIYSWLERSNYGKVSCSRIFENAHSDDSAIRPQIQCTKPLGHGTPIGHSYCSSASVGHLNSLCMCVGNGGCCYSKSTFIETCVHISYFIHSGVFTYMYVFLQNCLRVPGYPKISNFGLRFSE